MKSVRNLSLILLSIAAAPLARGAESPDSVTALPQVVVTGTRNAVDARLLPSTVTVVNREQIADSHQPSLLPILSADVPGLFVTSRSLFGYAVNDAGGAYSMRGMTGNGRLMVLVDGHPQYAGIMGHPISDAANSVMAQKVEVVRSPASVVYGSNAMAGVINIVTRQEPSDGAGANFSLSGGSYGTLLNEGFIRVRKGKVGGLISRTWGHSDGHRKNMGFDQNSGYARINYDFARNWSALADINLLHFDAKNPGAVTAPLTDARQDITRGTASMAIDNRYGALNGSVSIFYNWGNHWINDGYAPGADPRAYRFMSRDHTLGVSVYENVPLWTGNVTTFGFDYMNIAGHAWNRYVEGDRAGTDDNLADKKEDQFAGYIDMRQQIGHLSINAGVRADHRSSVGTEWVPQGGISWQLPRDIQLKATVAKGFRWPTLREMYMFPPQNPDLKPERLWNYELAYFQAIPTLGLNYGFNLYYINAENLITTVRRQGATPLNLNTGRKENYGLEAQLSWHINRHWQVGANYSYLIHKYSALVGTPDMKLNLNAAWRSGRWTLTTNVQYINGFHYAEHKTDSFLLWNATGQFKACEYVDVFTRLDNILAQKYQFEEGYPMPRMTAIFGVNIHLNVLQKVLNINNQ